MLSLDDVNHIARLARIRLTEAEKEKFQKDLSAILDFVKKLEEVDTANVPPTAQVTGIVNAFRGEEGNPSTSLPSGILGTGGTASSALRDAAPEQEGGYVKVKAVFE